MTERTAEQEGTLPGSGGSTEEGTPGAVPNDPAEHSASEQNVEPHSFPREYVEKLREESPKYRQKAWDRDARAERLHVALVAATGRLADPSDLPLTMLTRATRTR